MAGYAERGDRDEGHGPDGHGDEPRQVHRVPHLLGHLQADLDQPRRHRVRVVQQRRDPAGTGLPAPQRGPGDLEGRLDPEPPGPAAAAGPGAGSSGCSNIFASPVQPKLEDYYEPWTYDYANLDRRPARRRLPGRPAQVADHRQGHEDHLVGELGRQPRRRAGAWATSTRSSQKLRRESEDKIKFEFEQTFMFYLPRICEHCLNPSCMASCPSGAIYKRVEDGIVLVDQDRCRGWRQCITGCPYKKIYFNHKTGKAEKCTFCYPRIEVGLPTVCSETCVGRLRYLGLFLYDADAVTGAASTPDDKDLYQAQLDLILDPSDPEVIAGGARARASPTTGWTPPGARRSTRSPRSTRWRCRCTRSTGPCRWSGTSRRCRRSSTCSATRATTRRTRATCSAPSTRCASR